MARTAAASRAFSSTTRNYGRNLRATPHKAHLESATESHRNERRANRKHQRDDTTIQPVQSILAGIESATPRSRSQAVIMASGVSRAYQDAATTDFRRTQQKNGRPNLPTRSVALSTSATEVFRMQRRESARQDTTELRGASWRVNPSTLTTRTNNKEHAISASDENVGQTDKLNDKADRENEFGNMTRRVAGVWTIVAMTVSALCQMTWYSNVEKS